MPQKSGFFLFLLRWHISCKSQYQESFVSYPLNEVSDVAEKMAVVPGWGGTVSGAGRSGNG
jgi:hypothetical protein